MKKSTGERGTGAGLLNLPAKNSLFLAGRPGFEPELYASEAHVLPLDDLPIGNSYILSL